MLGTLHIVQLGMSDNLAMLLHFLILSEKIAHV